MNDLELPALVQLIEDIHECDCCGRKGLKRAIELSLPHGVILYLGVVCAGRWFKMNLTGNPWYAADKLGRHLRTMDNKDIGGILDAIRESAADAAE